jgi:hypothetical protein
MRHYRPNRTEVFKQGTVGFLLIAGLIVAFCSGVLMMVFAVSGMVSGSHSDGLFTTTKIGTIIGLVMVAGSAGFGFWSLATERSGPRKSRPAKVVARYAFNRQGLMLVSQWEIEACPDAKYFVRLDYGYPDGTQECECTEQVFYQCGEGMTGMAQVQGKWIGSFVPNVGANYQTEHIQMTDQQILFPESEQSGADRDQPSWPSNS